MGSRGPESLEGPVLRTFAILYYQDFLALAEGRDLKTVDFGKLGPLLKQARHLRLADDDEDRLKEMTRREIQAGRLLQTARVELINDRKVILLFELESTVRQRMVESVQVATRLPGLPTILRQLENATNPDVIRAICLTAFRTVRTEVRKGELRDVRIPVWPIEVGSEFPIYLSKHADQIISVKSEPRFPKSVRPSSKKKRLWFYACALAGAVLSRSTRTVINKLGAKPPLAEPILDVEI